MTLLLVLTALLVIVSGLVKLHAGEKAGLGVTVLPLIEIVAGLGLMAAITFTWRPDARLGLFIVFGAVALVLVSSIVIGLAIRRRRKAREASEGARLVTFVKYLSRPEPPEQ